MSPSMNEARREAVANALGRWPLRGAEPRPLWLDAQGLADADGHRIADAELPASGLDLLLSEHLLTPLVAEAGLDLPGAEDIRQHAAHLLGHYHGPQAQGWPLAPWSQGHGALRRCGAWALSCAGSGERWTALQARLRSARPASLACLEACRRQEPAWARAPHATLAWVESGLLCWLELQAGVLQSVRHLRLAAPTPEALCRRLQPLLARLPAGSETLLAGCGLSAPLGPPPAGVRVLGSPEALAAARPDPLLWAWPAPAPREASGDFLPPVQSLARWRWPLLGVAMLCLGLASQEAWQAHAQRQFAQDSVSRLQARQASPAPRVDRGAKASTAEPKALLEARQALHHPWPVLLAQVEAAALDEQQRPRVAWLGLDLQAARAEVRLEGQAEDRSQILAVADALARLPGWTEVLPAAIQAEEGGRPGLRFSLQARLAPALAAEAGTPVGAAASAAAMPGGPP